MKKNRCYSSIILVFFIGYLGFIDYNNRQVIKKQKQQLHQGKTIINSLDRIVWTKSVDDIMLDVSDSWLKSMFQGKLKKSDVIGRSVSEFLGEENNERYKKNDKLVIDSKKSMNFIEYVSFKDTVHDLVDTFFYPVKISPLFTKESLINGDSLVKGTIGIAYL